MSANVAERTALLKNEWALSERVAELEAKNRVLREIVYAAVHALHERGEDHERLNRTIESLRNELRRYLRNAVQA